VFEIRIYGDPVLRKAGKKIDQFGGDLKKFVEEMVVTMREKDGVGLAATQVGKSVQVAVVDVTQGQQPPFVLVNPEIVWSSKEIADEEEGCLSVPTIRLNVKRPASVSVRALDGDGKEYRIEKAEDILARALQHEVDHLNGVLFIDRVSLLQRKLISGKLKKLADSGDEKK
jgi:peptide deformylase